MFYTSLAALLAFTELQPDEERSIVPPGQWVVDYGRMSCTLARREGGEGTPVVALNAPLAREPGELLILEGGSDLDPRLAGPLRVGIGAGAPVELRGRRDERGGRSAVRLSPTPEDFLDRIAAAERLIVSREGETLLSLDLPQASQAVEALVRCNDDLMESWGVDVEARRALTRQAQLSSRNWMFEIQPRDAAGLVFVADVSDRGIPLGCRVVVSSGNERLDEVFCRRLRSRGRFEPALDAEGRRVRADYVNRITWVMAN